MAKSKNHKEPGRNILSYTADIRRYEAFTEETSQMTRKERVMALRQILQFLSGINDNSVEYERAMNRVARASHWAKYNSADDARHKRAFYIQRMKKTLRKNPTDCTNIVKYLEEIYDKRDLDSLSLANIAWLAHMDMYAMFRMFTNFDPDKTTPPGCPTPQYSTMKNLVVYCGARHSELYEHVLREMNFTAKWSERSRKGEAVINLDPPFDFFS